MNPCFKDPEKVSKWICCWNSTCVSGQHTLYFLFFYGKTKPKSLDRNWVHGTNQRLSLEWSWLGTEKGVKYIWYLANLNVNLANNIVFLDWLSGRNNSYLKAVKYTMKCSCFFTTYLVLNVQYFIPVNYRTLKCPSKSELLGFVTECSLYFCISNRMNYLHVTYFSVFRLFPCYLVLHLFICFASADDWVFQNVKLHDKRHLSSSMKEQRGWWGTPVLQRMYPLP